MYASMVHLRILLQNYRNVRLTPPSLYYCCSAHTPSFKTDRAIPFIGLPI